MDLFSLPSEPEPVGYKLVVGGAVGRTVYPTYDAAFTAATDARLDDYEIVPVTGEDE